MECAEKWITNPEFIREFNRKSEHLRIPLSGSIDLTHRCNLRCIHCYLGQTSHNRNRRRNEMSTGKILSVLDEITEAGCLYLLITGGEPLLREDFPEIYSHAKRNGLIMTVFTNGTLINDRIAGLFEDLPPRVIEISLYGATASTYEKITGVAGSYGKCVNAIESLLARKIPVGLKTILMTVNSHEFFDIEDMARKFGVKFRFDAAIFPCLNGDRAPLKLRVPPEEAVEKEFSDMDRARKWEQYFNRSRGQMPNDNLYNCGAGITSFHIDPYGNLQPCIMPTDLNYNLSEGGFLKGWCGIIAGIRAKKAGKIYQCNECVKRHLCGFCPAFFKLESGAEDICSGYLCSMGEHRFLQIRKSGMQGAHDAA